MSLYQLNDSERSLKPFKPSNLGSKYHEKDLENWLEANPQVLVSDEPLLIIGRQVNTPIGVIDLLALDAEGAVVVIELKRAPEQRKTIAQSLEYAAWLHEKSHTEIKEIAKKYLKGKLLENAWDETFNSELPNLSPEKQHRIIVVIEGENERLVSVAQYLQSSGVDIALLQYNFYQTDGGEEILLIENVVGNEESQKAVGPTSQAFPSEEELLSKWNTNVRKAYEVFREEMRSDVIKYTVKRTQVSYRKVTDEGKIFLCGFHGSGENFKLWLRSDSLNSIFDFQSIASKIKADAGEDIEILHTNVWFVVTYPASEENAKKAAKMILTEIVDRV